LDSHPLTTGARRGAAAPFAPVPPTGAADWNQVALEWQLTPRAAVWRAHSDAVYGALLDRWLPRDGLARILKTDLFDEAVSAGVYPCLAARAGAVIGVDLAHITARQAVRRHPDLNAAGADVRGLPFPDGAFDAVVSLSTLDHFPARADLESSLAELRRVLRAGGTLVLTLDNLSNPLIRLRNLLPFALVHRTGLVPYFVGESCTPRTAAALLGALGFRVDETTAVLHVPRVAAVPAAALVQRYGGPAGCARFLAHLLAWERLARWPLRTLTGHYVALRATKLV